MKRQIETLTTIPWLLCAILALGSQLSLANIDDSLVGLDLNDLLDIDIDDEEQSQLQIYGYIRANVEKVFDIPYVDGGGNTQSSTDPKEWSNPNFHIYGESKLNSRISVLFNVFGDGSDVEIRNAWGNIKHSDALQFRVGKQYRRFGLFNEKLDAIPVFVGIEPPELFDGDHLLLPRTTEFAIHGSFPTGNGEFSYFFDTDNGEGGAAHGVHPLGWDFRYKGESIIFGVSGYQSSIGSGQTTSTVGVGEGSPSGGVLPWMAGDEYDVVGAFLETGVGNWFFQTAYWKASHDAQRDPASVLMVINNANVNQAQRVRFLGANAGTPNALLTTADVVVNTDYDVKTAFFRVGYQINHRWGKFIPYFHWDWMENPETIQSKTWGGDNEAGFADDGEFTKYSIGVVFKPLETVAIKLDTSSHEQKFNGSSESYPEVRLDISFAFKM